MFQLKLSDMISAFHELGEEAVKAGKIIDLCVYDGSRLMMVSDFREASRDIDAVATTDQPFIDQVAKTIAERRSWPQDWLNDGMRTYLSPTVDEPDQHLLSGTYPSEAQPGLRVYTPTAEHMLATKLMALRLDEPGGGRDRDDIINLMQVVGIATKKGLVDLAAGYYPEAKVSAKLLLSADSLVASTKEKEKTRHAPPRYAGRGRGGLEGR